MFLLPETSELGESPLCGMVVTPAGLHPPEAGLVSGQLFPFKVKVEERELREASGGGGGAWLEPEQE